MHLFRSDGVAQARGAACTATRSGRVKSQWYEPS